MYRGDLPAGPDADWQPDRPERQWLEPVGQNGYEVSTSPTESHDLGLVVDSQRTRVGGE
jgi:hypothetical protein